MSNAQNIKAGEAFIIISAKLDQLRADLKKGQDEVKGFGQSLTSIGSSIAGVFAGLGVGAAITGIVKSFVDFGSEINDMSTRTGLATTQLQEMKFAAGQTGASLEDVEKAARHFVKEGGSVSDFERIGLGIASITDPSEKARAALDNFGKTGTRLIPMFEEFKSLKAASAAIGPILTEAEVRTADALGDSFSALKESLARAMNQIAASFGPQLKAILDTMIGMIAQIAQAIKQANPFGQGGDLLDQLAEVSRRLQSGDFESFRKQGAAGSRSFAQRGLPFETDGESKAAKDSADGMRAAENMWRSIDAGNKSRLSLIQSFETPAERFIRRQKEINDALIQVNKNRVLGFLSPAEASGQRSGLEEAMRRLSAEESERLGKLFKPVEAKAIERFEPLTSSKGTFSAFGAGLLGKMGDSASLNEARAHTRLLRNIEKNTAKNTGPKFS